MSVWETRIDRGSSGFAANRARMLAQLDEARALERRTAEKSAAAKPLFDQRGQLLPRERMALLLDPGAAFIELSALAGYTFDRPESDKSIPGGGSISGVGFVAGVRCVIVASDSAIEAGSIRPMGQEKMIHQLVLTKSMPLFLK